MTLMRRARQAAMARSVLHALAQPLATASLAVETALVLQGQGGAEATRARLERAVAELDAGRLMLQRFMQGLTPATAATARPTALAALLRPAGLSLPLGADQDIMVLADAGLLPPLLAGLHAALRQPGPEVALLPAATTVGLRLAGPGPDAMLVRFWLLALRQAGLRPRRLIRGKVTEVLLRLPRMSA